MKLYYSPGACSLAPHILLEELGDKYDVERVDLATKKTETGADFTKINKKGYVPTLEVSPDFILTENAAILQYLVEHSKHPELLPKAGTKDHYRAIEMLNFIATEMHKTIGGLFAKNMPEEARAIIKQRATARLDYVNDLLSHQDYLLGKDFSAADIYAFVTLSWCPIVGLDLSKWPNIQKYVERIAQRPAVQATLKAEGLSK